MSEPLILTLKKDNEKNKNDIADIQQEQEIQNANIEQLQQENTELKAKDKELELECERLREDVNALPGVSDSSENITLNGTAEARFKKLGIGGNSWQETREGYNILKNEATIQSTNGIDFTVNEDKSVKASGTATANAQLYLLGNASGTNLVLTLKVNVSYKNLSGIDLIYRKIDGNYGRINNNQVLTPSEDMLIGAVYIQINNEKTVDETYYPMLVKGTEEKPYEPYGAMPSPEFPSEIQNCEDSVNFTICNKNLMQIDKTIFPFSKNGLDFNLNENGELVVNGTATAYTEFKIYGNGGKDYFLKLAKDKYYKFNNGTSTNKISIYFSGEKLMQFNNNTTKKIEIDTRLSSLTIQIQANATFSNEIFKLQLEEVQTSSSPSTEYLEHKEQSFTIPVQQKMLEEDKFEKINGVWKEKHNWLKIVLNGTENLFDTSTYSTAHINTVNFRIVNKGVFNKGTNIKSNKFSKKIGLWGEDIEGVNVAEPNNIDISISRDKIENLTSIAADNKIPIQNYLKKLYDEGNPIVIYVKLAEPHCLDCTEEQITVLEEIEKTAKSYGDVTHIFSVDEISPIFEAKARADITTMINNLQAQVLANEEV